MSDTNIAFAAIAPDVNAEMSRMKPNARTTVSSIMPTKANNAALLRVMVEIIRPQIRCRQHLPESEENREFDAHPNSKQRVQILLFVRTTGNISISKNAHTTCPHRRRIVSSEYSCR